MTVRHKAAHTTLISIPAITVKPTAWKIKRISTHRQLKRQTKPRRLKNRTTYCCRYSGLKEIHRQSTRPSGKKARLNALPKQSERATEASEKLVLLMKRVIEMEKEKNSCIRALILPSMVCPAISSALFRHTSSVFLKPTALNHA